MLIVHKAPSAPFPASIDIDAPLIPRRSEGSGVNIFLRQMLTGMSPSFSLVYAGSMDVRIDELRLEYLIRK